MPASRSADIEPTQTSLVANALAVHDDFMCLEDIASATKMPAACVRRTLWFLRKMGAVDSIESSGALWWFLTPDTDKRLFQIADRRKEDEPRVFKGRVSTGRRKTDKP